MLGEEPPEDSKPNSLVLAAGALEIGGDSWDVGVVPWLGSLDAEVRLEAGLRRGGSNRTGRRIGAGVAVGAAGEGRGTAAALRDASPDRFGAGARSGCPRIQRGASTTPVATQSAPAPAPLTQKPMIVAIVEMRPPPPDVAM